MYSRSAQGRYPRDLRIPKNYGGNAFPRDRNTAKDREQAEAEAQTAQAVQDSQQEEHINEPPRPASLTLPKLNFGLGNLLSKTGISLGLEELLLIGLILIIASEGGNDLLILMLALLLFIQ